MTATEYPSLSPDAQAEPLPEVRRTPWRRRPGLLLGQIFDLKRVERAPAWAALGWRDILLEWSVLFVAVLFYCLDFLDLGTRRMLPGNEAEYYQAMEQVLVNALSQFGQFPLWNPYVRTGAPLVGDPFLHMYNPLASVPSLLLGVMDGFKVSLFLSFLAAALGAWWLGAVLGMGRVGRLWLALMYAFMGNAAIKFIQGHYLFVIGFPWIAWSLASLMAAVQTRRRLYAGVAALSLALLAFSGNAYYAYFMLLAVIIFGLTVLIEPRLSRPYVSFRADRAKIFVTVGLLALGMFALQAVPSFQMWPYIPRASDAAMAYSHSIQQTFLNYLSNNPYRPDAVRPWIQPEEYYSYVGFWPFLALLALPLALRGRDKRPALFLALLFLMVLIWIDVKDMPWRDYYVRSFWLYQFRYPTRMLPFGALAVAALGALALDALWRLALAGLRAGLGRWSARTLAYAALLGLVAGYAAASVADLHNTNRRFLKTRDFPPVSEMFKWLREYDQSEVFVGWPETWHLDIIGNRLRYLDGMYPAELRKREGMLNRRPVEARPHYRVGDANNKPPDRDATAVRQFPNGTFYKLPHSLSFAFAVKNDRLMDPAGGVELQREETVPLPPHLSGPGTVEIIADAEPGSTLVVLQSRYPGWQVTVDGRPQTLLNVGGYLATEMTPGIHKYVFSFTSILFNVGLIVSLLSLAAVFGLMASDVRVDWRRTVARARALGVSLAALPGVARERLVRPLRAAAAARRPIPAGGPSMQRRTLEAVYKEGVLQPLEPLEFAENTRLRLTVDAIDGATTTGAPRGMERSVALMGTRLAWLSAVLSLEWVLFGLAMLVYSATRLWALDKFPIYFFTDEAFFSVTASDLLSRGFRDPTGRFFPIYFEAAGMRWTPVLPVYIHAISVALFGKSIEVTRATSAVVSILGVAAVSLILKLIFRARYWWVGALVMALIPAFFLHSRTAFETAIMASFYAVFLLFYLLYRTRSPWWLLAALPMGAATFYVYSNAQTVMGTLALLLLVSDLRYHLRQWRVLLAGAVMGAVLALPLLGFRADHPSALEEHLRVVGSYLVRPIPLQEKLRLFAQTYSYGISPQYWFFPNAHDIVRHRMKDYGFIMTQMLPLMALGLAVCLWRVRSAPHRAVLLAALAAPAGAAVLDIGITRVLAFVVPAGILISLGIEALLSRLPRRIPSGVVGVAVFALLSVASLNMLRDALTAGPLWYRDYGLYGMQWGARQLFEEVIPEYLNRDPKVRFMVTHAWANGTDRYMNFFVQPSHRSRVMMGTVEYYMGTKQPDLNPDVVLIMTPAEYNAARGSPKFKSVQAERMIPYPDGSPGFYLVRLAYADNLDAILAAEREARRQLVEAQVTIEGQRVRVRHSLLDMGSAALMFDGDRFTLGRGMEANPFILELYFPEPRPVTGLAAYFGAMEVSVTAHLYAEGSERPVSSEQTFRGAVPDRDVQLAFQGAPPLVSRMRLEIRNPNTGDKANIHLFELKLQR